MKRYRMVYYTFMSLAGVIAALTLAARRPVIGWMFVGLCLVLAFIFAERGKA